MTEQELHEKLTDILQMKLQELPLKPLGIIYKEAAEYLAVALIAEGMIFVDERTVILPIRMSGKTLIQKAQYYDQMKHRAEVAELVVKNLNDIFTFDYQYVFEQAEKELAEEGNK